MTTSRWRRRRLPLKHRDMFACVHFLVSRPCYSSAARVGGRVFVVNSTSDTVESFTDSPPYERLEPQPPPLKGQNDCLGRSLGRSSRVAWTPTDVVACAASQRLYISDSRSRWVKLTSTDQMLNGTRSSSIRFRYSSFFLTGVQIYSSVVTTFVDIVTWFAKLTRRHIRFSRSSLKLRLSCSGIRVFILVFEMAILSSSPSLASLGAYLNCND
jgi:hypothetical protein